MSLGTAATDASVQPAMGEVKPRLGFAGTGWIGRLRMQALLEAEVATCAGIHDPCAEAAQSALVMSDNAQVHDSLDALLASDVDGIVIATPSALHAMQCIRALEQGKAVFCQKPLGRSCPETRHIVEAARAADCLLAVDFSYRHLAGMARLRELIRDGALGQVFAAELVFHNAYGPDKAWFYDINAAGGGCVMDLGTHLVDLAMWLLDCVNAEQVSSSLYHQGLLLPASSGLVEDYAVADFMLGCVRTHLCCSWNLNAGRDAIIEASFFGTEGGAALRNVDGSFYDFEICRFTGTQSEVLGSYPDTWGGRALIQWATQLASAPGFDPQVEQTIHVADLVDRIYKR